ncbi:MAG: hypothetical protein VXZ82_11690 [Planctomycetota bacterium]|nr:hypothetical protein [Planctomycetota bacterium]
MNSSVDQQKGGRSVNREPELEKMFRGMGYDDAFVNRFHGGFLAVDLIPIGEDATQSLLAGNGPRSTATRSMVGSSFYSAKTAKENLAGSLKNTHTALLGRTFDRLPFSTGLKIPPVRLVKPV